VTALPDGYFFSFDKLDYVRGSRPGGCILCLIRDRSSEVEDLSIWRDDLFIVSVNLYPYNPGHLLVHPVRHIEDVREYTAAECERLDRLQRALLGLLDRAYAPCGYNIGYNMGRAAGASIGHLHLHLIPRYPHETGIADLIAGRRVLVEDPRRTAETLRGLAAQPPFSSSMS
jgi:ATP adenylyltransferase